jgi:hypothetical protein
MVSSVSSSVKHAPGRATPRNGWLGGLLEQIVTDRPLSAATS